MPEALETLAAAALPLRPAAAPRDRSTRSTAAFSTDDRSALSPATTARGRAHVAIDDHGGEKQVRMAHLASVGCHAINGVARCTPSCWSATCCATSSSCGPSKFTNVTNGVTPRRFMALADPELAALLTRTLGDGWVSDTRDRAARASRPHRGRRRLPGRLARRSSGATRSAWRRTSARRSALELDPDVAVRHPGEAHPRVQAAAPERAARHHPLPAAEAGSEGRDVPPRTVLLSAARPLPATSWRS